MLYLIATLNRLPMQPDVSTVKQIFNDFSHPLLFSACTDSKVSPLRFGTHVSGGSPVFRRVQLNNPTPFGKNDFCTATIDTQRVSSKDP